MRAYSLMYHDVVAPGDFESSGFPGGSAAIYKLERPHFEDHVRAVSASADQHGYERVSDPDELARRSP
ncbi:MAG: hypothetical protein AAGC55_07250, partial [Myxococcota bacterium]